MHPCARAQNSCLSAAFLHAARRGVRSANRFILNGLRHVTVEHVSYHT
jgi:hypothetical protein